MVDALSVVGVGSGVGSDSETGTKALEWK